MEAPKTLVLPGKVNIISYCALGSFHHRPVRRYGLCLSFACPPEPQHRREFSAMRFAVFVLMSLFINEFLSPYPPISLSPHLPISVLIDWPNFFIEDITIAKSRIKI